ncbi:MAG: competence/damage-inducible protein A [Flavobacteriaceae bacterium]|nr:competence/damage-inducible protein A [Flavobacteriaceae bacterium]
MLAEIITIGDEILIGQIVDTNSAYISKALNKIGIQVYQITSIQDSREHILSALNDAKNRVDLVLMTGGLGPTRDDITKQTLCEFFGDTLVENTSVTQHIREIFKQYIKREPLPTNLQQAMLPASATVLHNAHGTAPGMWFERDGTVFVSMPGVPYEMKHILRKEVFPRVTKKFNRPHIYHKTLLTYGLGESAIADRIENWENSLPDSIKLAYLPSLGRVRLRLSSKGVDEMALKEEVDAKMAELYRMLDDIAVGYEEETSLVERIAGLLSLRNQSLSLAESCTGGAIVQELTAVAGASTYLHGSIVPYQTGLKIDILGVEPKLIKDHTVVSDPVVRDMAKKAKTLFQTDYAVATTGIAGPSQGEATQEVGTVFIGVATPSGVVSEKFQFGNARERVIKKATNKALEMLLKEILKN